VLVAAAPVGFGLGAAAPPKGEIEGRVSFLGQPPAPFSVPEGGTTQHVLHLDEHHGLRYAVAFLEDAAAVSGAAPPPATLSQSGFIFQPQVLAVREGQSVRFTNEDSANHNVHSRSGLPANRFNAYTGMGHVHTARFHAEPGHAPLLITCDIHPWMVAWIYAFEHPYFAVTDGAGRFRIIGVPPGLHLLAVRQPAGGLARDLRVRVEAGAAVRVEVVFGPADLRSAHR
jgi:plastocyanin